MTKHAAGGAVAQESAVCAARRRVQVVLASGALGTFRAEDRSIASSFVPSAPLGGGKPRRGRLFQRFFLAFNNSTVVPSTVDAAISVSACQMSPAQRVVGHPGWWNYTVDGEIICG